MISGLEYGQRCSGDQSPYAVVLVAVEDDPVGIGGTYNPASTFSTLVYLKLGVDKVKG